MATRKSGHSGRWRAEGRESGVDLVYLGHAWFLIGPRSAEATSPGVREVTRETGQTPPD